MEGTQYRIYLYGQENVDRDLVIHEPPAYRSLYITNAAVDDNGHLILTFSDDSTIDSGLVRGPTGSKGQKGDQGASVNWRGEWDSGTTYSYLDCVTSDGNVYIYTSKTASSAGISDTTKWDLMLQRGAPGIDGTNGVNGATFTPSVSADGILSWSNDSGKPNPASVNIRGEPGKGFKVIGYYGTYASLVANVTNPSAGDAYGVGASDPYDIYIWDGANNAWVNNGALQGAAGPDGAPGTTFTPHVSDDGVLSWTNDGGKPNPSSVSIKGPVGPTGPAGVSPEPLYVNCTIPSYDTYSDEITHDKTHAEILAAWQAGTPCYAILKLAGATHSGGTILSLTKVDSENECVEFAQINTDAPDTPDTLVVCDIIIYAAGGGEGIWTTRITASKQNELLPDVTASDNGKFLRVVNGAWAAASISNANGGSF